MAFLAVIPISMLVLVGSRHSAVDVTGHWIGRFAVPSFSDRDANRYVGWTLQLNADGTFSSHLHYGIMVDVDEQSHGTYLLDGANLRLKGDSSFTLNDGYVKSPGKRKVEYRLSVASDRLSLEEGFPWANMSYFHPRDDAKVVFWRPGAVPLPPPPSRDPKAVAILKLVERTYAALKTYKDNGTYNFIGRARDDWKVAFSTRFSRANAFRFQSTIWEGGRACEQAEVWSRGTQSWGSMSIDGGSKHKWPLESGLAYVADAVGIEALLIPHLLAPEKFKRTLSMAYPGVRLKRVEMVGKKRCSVVELSNPDEGMSLTIWVDDVSHFILRAGPLDTGRITYNPIVNPRLSDAELLGHPVPPGKSLPHHRAPRGSENYP